MTSKSSFLPEEPERRISRGYWAQEFIIYLYIGPVAQAEDKDLSKEEKSSSEETV